MKRTLVLARSVVDRARSALAVDAGARIELWAGRRLAAGEVEWIAPMVTPPSANGGMRVFVYGLHDSLRGMTSLYLRTLPRRPAREPRIEVALHPDRGASVFLFAGDQVLDLDAVTIRGTGMETWVASERPPDLQGTIPRDGRFSRYIGALGGSEIHHRIRGLVVAICGVSRTGSLIATHLVRAGVRRLVLVDPDVVEDHQLDAMDVAGRRRIGMHKVQAVAAELRRIDPEVEVLPVPHRLEEEPARSAVLKADVIVTSADSHRPRVLSALMASAYGKVHVDIGTGVLRSATGVEMGLDVRIMPPGACILCNGGVAIPRVDGREDWRALREGSLRSLNGMASSLAMHLLEQLVRGDLSGAAWWTVRLDLEAREPFVRHPTRVRAGCPVCWRAGWGDAAMRTEKVSSRA